MRQSLVAVLGAVVMSVGSLVAVASAPTASAAAVVAESATDADRDGTSDNQASIRRIGGGNRYETAANVARSWAPNVAVAYVVGGADYPDAMTAASRAGVHDAPLLLTRRATLPSETKNELARLQPQRVVVVGGAGAVSATVMRQLRSYAVTGDVRRVAGSNRYRTAAEVASLYPSGQQRVYLANGQDFPDGLAGAALAAHQQAPLLLTPGDTLDAASRAELRRLSPSEVVVLGGSSAVTDRVAEEAAT